MKEKPRPVSQDHYLLEFEGCVETSLPGQFLNIRVSDRIDPLLRRPFSIFNHERDIISCVIRTVGKGTEILARRDPGKMDLLGPLGTGFTLVSGSRVLIAGGGVGNAPLYYLARKLAASRCDITFIYGARSREYIYLPDRFRDTVGRFIVATDDGSEGERGLVTDIAASLFRKERYDMVYTCGPGPMMKALTALAGTTPIEVSVENYFGCGIGLCSGCVIETTGGRKRACVDGPVFNGAAINWSEMPD
ncbi:MAG: dihydroorotate dehydrogenase electron transfer subunit [Spirochaetes bacterium]|nr:dihydroorotate dehydrogenase electron transfer subunit [Spirochaetota bacterium]